MYHSITIGTKNTWDDWHLIPASRPFFTPPKVKTNTVDIPGGDGVIDLTEVLAGRPTFNNRSGSWNFYVDSDYKPWFSLYSEIMTYLHGQKMRAVLEDDPLYYYEGRFSVNTWKTEQNWSQITINYDVEPFKYEIVGGSAWIWDTFNFKTGEITTLDAIEVNGTRTLYVDGVAFVITPVIIASAAMSMEYEGETYQLRIGRNIPSGLTLHTGTNKFIFNGNGTITLERTGARL
nr:MAG TPA: distal tail protein [Caudoviricetes sp.]